MTVQWCTEDSDWMRDYAWLRQDPIESTSFGIELQTCQLLDTSACHVSLSHQSPLEWNHSPHKSCYSSTNWLMASNKPRVVTWSAIIVLWVVGLQWHCRGFYSGWMCGLISKLVAYQNPMWMSGLCCQNGLVRGMARHYSVSGDTQSTHWMQWLRGV